MKFKFFILFIALIWSVELLAKPVEIIGFRAAASADKTRLVFELTNKITYSVFRLSQPDRLVLDIPNSHVLKSLDKIQLSKTPIKSLRVNNSKDHLRIVIDLKQPLIAKSFILPAHNPHPYRLVIDLVQATPQIEKKFSAKIAITELPAPPKIILAQQPNSVPAPTTNVNTNSPAIMNVTPTPPPVIAIQHKPTARSIVVVIDPGHGGKDPGTTGLAGTHEKDVVLAIARDLQRTLNNEPGFRAVLTRNGDYYIPLRGRLDIARRDKADIFISIHADAYRGSDTLGASVFALSERGATSEAARWLAEKENNSELLGGASLPDNDSVLRSVLIDLSQTNTISESLQIGSSVLRQLGKITELHHPRVEQAAFVVLKSPDIPSLLVETGFLSTPQQEQQLRNPRYQQLLATSIMQGIKAYFVHNPLQGTLFASK